MNGLFVNGKKVKVQDLKGGDELIWGPDARVRRFPSKNKPDARLMD